MKKIISLILCMQILNIPAFAYELINDPLVETTLSSKKFTSVEYKQQEIEDALVNSTLDRKNQPPSINDTPIIDTFSEKNIPTVEHKSPTSQQAIQDEFANAKLKNCTAIKPNINSDYNFELVNRTPIKISINSDITTKKGLKEGQGLEFKVVKDVKLNGIILKKDSIVNARLETISPNQAFGVPADMVVENFIIKQPNQTDLSLDGSIHKTGANRSLWVYPVGYAGLMLFFAGVLIFPIRGGHAKIRTKDIYEVYYIPRV